MDWSRAQLYSVIRDWIKANTALLPSGGTIVTKTVELDFGNVGLDQKIFTVQDDSLPTSSFVSHSFPYRVPVGEDLDKLEMDSMVANVSKSGTTLTLLVKSLTGRIHGKYLINYRLKV